MLDNDGVFERVSRMSLEEARQLAVQLLRVLQSPDSASAEPSLLADTGPTVRELFEAYMTRHGNRVRSARWMRNVFEKHLSELAKRIASTIRAQEVATFHADMGANVGNPIANRALEILRAVYNRAIEWGLYNGGNPCAPVKTFPLESRDRYLSRKDEIDRFLTSLASMRSATFRNFIKTCLFTAARVNNVQAMRWEELDLEAKTWRIPRVKSKALTVRSITVPLIDEAIAAIEAQRGKHEDWVFPGRGKTGHLVNPARAWQRLITKAGIKNLRMHDLRRTMGSWQANTGASLQVIQKTLGHSSIRATHIYARLQLEPVRSAMEAATKAMLS
jgi:integrase